jgi:WD40 repeat protein
MDVVFTGSADRTVKLWDLKNSKASPCIQTLAGHEGSILDMVYIDKVD